ncbi:MAG: RNA-directed DNA polymerase [Deltaproteobacteria bacterium]|nr:RNA-directed DNA polymerase [Deltaproteobacteria bacterium]
MAEITVDHFKRAVADIGVHGDNDTLPFDIDNRFINECQDELATLAHTYFVKLENGSRKAATRAINALQIFSERLLVPTGPSGFRITTKIHPFWNIYINGLGVAIAAKHEAQRSLNAHSYRYVVDGEGLFDRNRSWRAYRQCTISSKHWYGDDAVVIQTDISSFYEHIYHHRLESCINDLFPPDSTVATQIARFLSKFASGRSFGLPVGGQCARILAEVLMSAVDNILTDEGIIWHRYVDDFTIMAQSQEDAYRALAVLSHALADYGLSLNRTKTIILKAKHYLDYVNTQLAPGTDEAGALRQMDLHFDPYSDTAHADYDELKDTVRKLDVPALLELETTKGQPDSLLVAQIGRSLRFQTPEVALQLCATLLDRKNLNAFRGSWSRIMRGVAAIRGEPEYKTIFADLDVLLDEILKHSRSLLVPEVNCLHYLRTIRFGRTTTRAKYVVSVYNDTSSETVRRGCIECWWSWRDRPNFIRRRNQWQTLGAQEQRMLWLAAGDFGEEGKKTQDQLRTSLSQAWQLGIERRRQQTFGELYTEWAESAL